MASEFNNPIANIELNLDKSAKYVVLRTDELILTILSTLQQFDNGESFVQRYNENNYRKCMLINKQWCIWAQGFLWRHLVRPREAFNSVLRQFDVAMVGTYSVAGKDLILKRPRDAYVRLCHYTSMVESMQNYVPSQESDNELFTRLKLFDLPRDIFPRLKKITLQPEGEEFWFPLAFRNHSVKDLCVEGAIVPRGCIRDILKYCAKLERLQVSGRLHELDIDLLQVYQPVYLTSLSLQVEDVHLDNTLRIIFSISHNLTDLTLTFLGTTPPTTIRRSHAFKSLKSLRLHRLSTIARSLNTLPSAPKLEYLGLTSISSDVVSEAAIRVMFKAIEEYSNRSPFTNLLLNSTSVASEDHICISTLDISCVRELTRLSFAIGYPAGLLFPSPVVWPQLTSLTLLLGQVSYPNVTLGDLFHLISQAPQLETVTARVDLRMESNPKLVCKPTASKTSNDEDEPDAAEALYVLHQDIAQYRANSLRIIDFHSSILLKYDQLFLFTVLREVAPNLSLSARMLKTLAWSNQATRKAAIAYVRTSPSISDFLSFLS